jgi:RHH-type rel operon transcriptional repressor/antitoxin RelB
MSTAISLRLPKQLAQALEALASSTDRPKSYLVRKAVETYLAEYADYQIALDRLHDKDDPIISGSELRRQLGLSGRL